MQHKVLYTKYINSIKIQMWKFNNKNDKKNKKASQPTQKRGPAEQEDG